MRGLRFCTIGVLDSNVLTKSYSYREHTLGRFRIESTSVIRAGRGGDSRQEGDWRNIVAHSEIVIVKGETYDRTRL